MQVTAFRDNDDEAMNPFWILLQRLLIVWYDCLTGFYEDCRFRE